MGVIKYFILPNVEKWEAINTAPFTDPNSVTKQLVEVVEADDGRKAAVVPMASIGKTAKYLTPEDAAELIAGLIDELPEDWTMI